MKIKTEKPIIFSTPMVKAILDNSKWQTRRVINLIEFKLTDTPGYKYCFRDRRNYVWNDVSEELLLEKYCPYQKGEILWVRETFVMDDNNNIGYRASKETWHIEENGIKDGTQWINWQWKPSIFMPRSAARIFLKIKNIRVEQIKAISIEDIIAEGIIYEPGVISRLVLADKFSTLWDSINKKRGYGIDANPWVWIIEFERTGNPQC